MESGIGRGATGKDDAGNGCGTTDAVSTWGSTCRGKASKQQATLIATDRLQVARSLALKRLTDLGLTKESLFGFVCVTAMERAHSGVEGMYECKWILQQTPQF